MSDKQKILIVDDSPAWIKYHQDVLGHIYGDKFILDTALSGREGYEKVYNNINTPYSLIISDLQMEYDFEPEYAGEWFIEQVKKLKEYSNTSIIIMSATYNIRTIAENLNVSCLQKATAARDLNAYKLAIEELLKV